MAFSQLSRLLRIGRIPERLREHPLKPPDWKSTAVRFGLIAAAAALVFAVLAPNVALIQKLELVTQDIRMRLRGERPVHPAIATVEIGESALARYGNSWPLPRDFYALLLHGMQEFGVRVTAFDLMFIGPDANAPADGGPITNDQVLAAVIAEDPRFISGFYFPLTSDGPHDLVPPESLLADPRRALWMKFTAPLPSGVSLLTTTSVPFDMEENIAEASASVGHIGLRQDIDGTIRSLPLLVNFHGRAFPSMSLLMASMYLGADWRQIHFEGGKAILPYPGGEVQIPVDRNAQALINYPGPRAVFAPGAVQFDSLMDDIKHYDAVVAGGKRPPADARKPIHGRIVLVCNTAVTTAITDFGPTPFDQTSPLAYAHASMVNSILRDDYLTRVPRLPQIGVWALLALGFGVMLAALAPITLGVTALVTMLFCLVVSWAMATFGGYVVETVPPVLMIGGISIAHLMRGYIIRDTQRRIAEQELAVAKKIQQNLLPKDVLASDGVEVSGKNLPCFAVGGDYFDYFRLADGRVALAIADVSGKGVPAALLMSNLQAILRAECARGTDVPLVPTQANRQLMESMSGSSKFVTFFYGALDPVAKRLYYSNAGHNPPVIVRANGAIEELATGGLLLGVFALAEYDQGTVDLGPGDVVVLFTDGVTEAEDRKQELYGDARLHELLRRERHRSAKEIGDAICVDVERYSHGLHQTDDVTVLVVKVDGLLQAEPDNAPEAAFLSV